MINQQLREEITRLHAKICDALADPTRILILYCLAEQPHPVGVLGKILDLNQPTVSRHLQVLRERGLVFANREGQNVVYSLADDKIIQALDLLRAVLSENLSRQGALVESADINLTFVGKQE